MKRTTAPAPASVGNPQSKRDFAEVMAYAVTNALSMVVITDAQGVIEYVNKRFCKLTGYTADEAIGQSTALLQSGQTPSQTFESLWECLHKGEGWTGEFCNRSKKGRIFWELAYISPVHDSAGRIHHYLKIAADITGRKRIEARLQRSLDALRKREDELKTACQELEKSAQELDKSRRRMQRLAQRDALTGLLNRRGFNVALRRARALAERQGHGVGYLLLDVDHFKQINDEHGHAAGDRILKTLAARLRSCLRSADLICRFGGDEFVVALPDADAATTQLAAQRILEVVRHAEYRQGGKPVSVTVSIGAACETPGSLLTPEQVMKQTDRALYCAKRAGRNGLAFWPAQHEPVTLDADKMRCRPDSAALDLLVATLEARHRATSDHCRRVAKIATLLAETLALPAGQIENITQGALLHDIGKIAIPDAVLLKPGRFTDPERQIMHGHSQAGHNILQRYPDFQALADIALSHHERYDGTGYPRGLKGVTVSLNARIVAVADAYDTIRAGRPHAVPRSAAEALDEMQRCSGSQFDPSVVDALERCQPKIEALPDAKRADKPRRVGIKVTRA